MAVKKIAPFFAQQPNVITYDYLMFIYEFDPRTGKLISISDMFIPEDSEYVLAFPSGITYVGNSLAISYGDHDSRSKLLIIRDGVLNKILKPVITTRNNIIKTPLPDDINFLIFPRRCVAKDGLCKLILF